MVQFAPYLGPQGVLPYICHGYVPVCADPLSRVLACKNIRFSSPPTAKSEEKRMFTQTSRFLPRFGLKTGMGIEGTAECLRIYSFNSK